MPRDLHHKLQERAACSGMVVPRDMICQDWGTDQERSPCTIDDRRNTLLHRTSVSEKGLSELSEGEGNSDGGEVVKFNLSIL